MSTATTCGPAPSRNRSSVAVGDSETSPEDAPEANAIALEIEKATTPRPQTHDLLRNLVTGLNATVERVVVTELRNDTFYAVVWMRQDGECVTVDARPSDAIALALRCDCPIFVSEEVLRIAKLAPGASDTSPEELRRWLEGLNDEDLGRYKM